MEKIGIITFHASHNFGSVMQAWSLQEILKEMGYTVSILNFRMLSQKDKYSDFPLHSGMKLLIRDLIQIKDLPKKHICNQKYENFINTQLLLTKEANTADDLRIIAKEFDIFLAGSDQIWGYSIPEFMHSKEDMRGIYYLDFTNGYKISYASSTGTSTIEEMSAYSEFLKQFSYISVREDSGREIIKRLTGKEAEVVLDPTYLIPHEKWMNYADQSNQVVKEPYIIIYSLQGRKKTKKWKELISNIQKQLDTKFVCVFPFAPLRGENIIDMSFAGPEEILNLFKNAKYVFTDTFHGMSFAIHFQKNFSLFEGEKTDARKQNILDQFGLSNRVSYDIQNSAKLLNEPVDYEIVKPLIMEQVKNSLSFLEKAVAEYTH